MKKTIRIFIFTFLSVGILYNISEADTKTKDIYTPAVKINALQEIYIKDSHKDSDPEGTGINKPRNHHGLLLNGNFAKPLSLLLHSDDVWQTIYPHNGHDKHWHFNERPMQFRSFDIPASHSAVHLIHQAKDFDQHAIDDIKTAILTMKNLEPGTPIFDNEMVISMSSTEVPEPGHMLLLGIGFIVMAVLGRKKTIK